MISSTQTIYKLTILYMLDSVDFQLSNAIISDFILREEFTDYFNIQTALNELIDDGLISASTTYKTTYYGITTDGRDTLDCFHYEISVQIKDDVKRYLKEHFNEIVETLSVVSDYSKYSDNNYIAECKILERGTFLASIKLSVASEKQAQSVCANFKNNSSELYTYLIKKLL